MNGDPLAADGVVAVAVTERELSELGSHVLLAIDTAIGTSVALGVDGRVYEAASDDPMRHAEVIGELIAEVIGAAGVRGSAVTAVVAGIGPGPFTGLRVGIAAAHSYAAGLGVPVLPLHGHEAVALQVLEAGAAAGVCVVQDARRRELFVTEYSGLDWAGVPVRSVDPHLVARASYEAVANEVWPERIPAGRLVQLAARRLASGGAFEADEAVYLRAPDVKPASAPKRVSA